MMRVKSLALFSSALVLISPATKAFHVSAPNAASPWTHSQVDHSPRSRCRPQFGSVLFAEASQETEPTASSSGQQKVRSMASFLVTQMLQKVMLEASKGDGKSKLSEADALSLLETLQTVSEAKTAQDKLSTTWQAAEEAVEEKVVPDELDVAPVPVPVDEITPVKTKPEKIQVAPVVQQDSIVIEKEKSTKSAPETLIPMEMPAAPKSTVDPVATSKQEQFQRSLLAARLQNDAVSHRIQPESVMEVAEPPAVTPTVVDTAAAAASIPTMNPRFPEIISKDFGKPLEVTASDIPALRESSIPQRSNDTDSSAGVASNTDLAETPESTLKPLATPATKIETAIHPEETSTVLVDVMTAETREELDAPGDVDEVVEVVVESSDERKEELSGNTESAGTDVAELNVPTEGDALDNEVDAYSGTEVETTAEEATETLSSIPPVEAEVEELPKIVAEPLPVESKDGPSIKDKIRSFWNQNRTEPMFPSRTDSSEDIPEEVLVDTDERTIAEVRRQPKSPEEEARLAAKYAQIEDLGDRAFAILKDLRMI